VRVLLDTCVVSENQHPKGAQRVKGRVQGLRSQDTFVSVITVGEIAKGIQLLDEGPRRAGFSAFLDRLEHGFARRVLGIDFETARIWGEITARAQKSGRVLPASDGLIAATAIQHGLQVMTRNVSDFEETGAAIINPWEDA
jgi:predicted nucleic acid-binding protein